MGVGEAELDELATLVDGRGGHRGGRGEVAELHNDAGVTHEALGDGDGLPRIGLCILEIDLDGPAGNAAGAVRLGQSKVEPTAPIGTVLGVLAGQRAADAHHDRGFGGAGGQRQQRQGGESAAGEHGGVPVGRARPPGPPPGR